jgi:hypothetical protein
MIVHAVTPLLMSRSNQGQALPPTVPVRPRLRSLVDALLADLPAARFHFFELHKHFLPGLAELGRLVSVVAVRMAKTARKALRA